MPRRKKKKKTGKTIKIRKIIGFIMKTGFEAQKNKENHWFYNENLFSKPQFIIKPTIFLIFFGLQAGFHYKTNDFPYFHGFSSFFFFFSLPLSLPEDPPPGPTRTHHQDPPPGPITRTHQDLPPRPTTRTQNQYPPTRPAQKVHKRPVLGPTFTIDFLNARNQIFRSLSLYI